MVLYFPALIPPLKPSGPSRNILSNAFCCRSLNLSREAIE